MEQPRGCLRTLEWRKSWGSFSGSGLVDSRPAALRQDRLMLVRSVVVDLYTSLGFNQALNLSSNMNVTSGKTLLPIA